MFNMLSELVRKKQRSVGDRLSSVSGTSALCHEVV